MKLLPKRPGRTLASLLLLNSCFGSALADGNASIPWTPSIQARSALHFLADEAQLAITLSHWPLPASAVREALANMPSSTSEPVLAAKRVVERELNQAEYAKLSVTVRNRVDDLNGFGEKGSPGSFVDLRTPAYRSTFVAAQAGMRVDQIPKQALAAFQTDAPWRLHDAGVATELWGWNLQAVANQRWWGVGWQSSLVLSSNVPSMNSLSLQRASSRAFENPLLAWAGPWSFEAFIGGMQNHITPVKPVLLGTRLTFRPLPAVELGLTKVTQTGGEGRPGGLKNLTRAFFGLNSNTESNVQLATDSGNSLAGFDLRIKCPAGWHCAGYGQIIGEDKAGINPTKYLGLWGAEWWSANGSQRYFAEYSNSHCNGVPGKNEIKGCAYVNSNYTEGYTHYNRWLGASQGPDSKLLSLGWLDTENQQTVKLQAGKIGTRLGTYFPAVPNAGVGSLWTASWQKQWKLGRSQLTPELSYTHLKDANTSSGNWRAGATISWPID
jgi:Capsule assembly protein Wzi